MKSEELTEKILNRVVYYLQGAFEVQKDLLIDRLNELLEDEGEPKETQIIEKYCKALDKLHKETEQIKKAKNSRKLNEAIKDLITAPNEQIESLAKSRVIELITDTAESIVKLLINNLSKYSGDYMVEDSVYELYHELSIFKIVDFSLEEVLSKNKEELER